MRSYCALFVMAVVPAALGAQLQPPGQAPQFVASFPPPVQEAKLKDPAVAGFLSWIVPGLGNFYAGHKPHGWRHVIIDVGGVGFVIVAAVTHANDPGGGVDAAFTALGVATLICNAIWATVSSVKDTEDYNRRVAGGRGGASLELKPRLNVLPGTNAPRAALEFGRFTF